MQQNVEGVSPLFLAGGGRDKVALPWVVWAVVRTAGFELDYPLVAVVSFTPYAALSSPLPVVVGLLLRRWAVAGVAAVAALALGLAMVPRALAGPEAEARGPRLVVMTSNAYVGRADARAILRIAREHDVDVLSLQELRPELMRRLDRVGAREQFPGRSVDARAGASGSGVLSRRPLESVETANNAKGHAQPEVVLRVPRAPPVWIKAVHPSPPVSAVSAPGWRRRSPRCREPTPAATSRSWPVTSTPRSTTASCARCSTAAGSTPPTRSARASCGRGRHAGAARSR